MRVREPVAALTLAMYLVSGFAQAQESAQPSPHLQPQLLLTARLLRRLQRDRERQTGRWTDFEKRVQTVPDSPERGFELALFYAVTHEEPRGREAVAWALAHSCKRRQVALVLDWAGEFISQKQLADLKSAACNSGRPQDAREMRDDLFMAIADSDFEQSRADAANKRLLDDLTRSRVTDPASLYASVEYLMAYRSFKRIDLRESEPQFFNRLPKEVLLRLTPDQVEHPDWMAHVAALALVTLDPNLENSQFLQGWAMEDRQMLREGPGVAYELLWADPYLPGIAYQNMDPWIYDSAGRLFARDGWEVSACWVNISGAKQTSQNCGDSLPRQTVQFGTLALMPATSTCTVVPVRKNRETIILWKLKPGAQLIYESGEQRNRRQADAAGMWQAPNDSSGKACLESQPKRQP